ncbi:MAG: hypothetical protein ABID40_03150 [Candidatus Bipolaricaulota bacterium]
MRLTEVPDELWIRRGDHVIVRTESEEWYGTLAWLGVGSPGDAFSVVLHDAWGPLSSEVVMENRFAHIPQVNLARVFDVVVCSPSMIEELGRRRPPEPNIAAPSKLPPPDPPTGAPFGSKLIADPVAGLEWNRSFENLLTWEGAKQVWHGSGPQWRIPTLLEWASLSGPPQLAVLRERGDRYWVANHSWAPGTWTVDSEKMAQPAASGEVAYLRLVRDLRKEVG